MTDNDISSTGVGVYLLKTSRVTTIGTSDARIVNISNNRVIGRSITSLVDVDSKSVLTVNGNSIYVMANLARCIMENRGKVNINLYGANSRFESSGNRVLENDEG